MPMLAKLAYRAATELSPRLAAKAAHLWVYKGMLAVRSYQSRLARKELYPPFMFVALTNTCNLRCHGCWVEKEGDAFHLPAEDLDNIIRSGKRRNAYYYTLLGGEPFMHKGIWDIFTRHKDCFFQAITNGMLFTEKNADRIAEELRKSDLTVESPSTHRLPQKGVEFRISAQIPAELPAEAKS